MDYKLLIPSAGLGTRLGLSYKNLNKALVSVDNKPVISHLIEKFSKDIEIVIALGHKGKLVKEYLELAHSKYKFQFIFVDNYFGKGSGLGYSILSCKDKLQSPFVFAPNDTIILEEIPEPNFNWIGYGNKKIDDNYRSLIINNQKVKKILEKKKKVDINQKPYIGLAGFKDYQLFWEYMENGRNFGSISIGESYAINQFLTNGIEIKGIEFDWYDTGNLDSLEDARKNLISPDSPEILDKPNEAIWFVEGKAIKYSSDDVFIKNRVLRAEILKGFVPRIIKSKDNIYSYKLIAGKTLSKISNKVIFLRLLEFLDSFWLRKDLTDSKQHEFRKACLDFYKTKTNERVKLFFNKFDEQDGEEIINGIKVPSIKEILKNIDWENLACGEPRRIHGDLHFENIILDDSGEFFLIDWRQDFSNILEYGDLYYDLSKLMHGLIISHDIINKGNYFIQKAEDIINFGFLRKNSLVENQNDFDNYLIQKKLDINKVKILTNLIFINIAPLHHNPYSKLLFYLGKYNLYQIVNSSRLTKDS